MMAQYQTIKSEHPDSLLFYRMGDFYETFFEDAVTTARVLNITLTRRGQHKGEDIPMAGVPFHAADSYLSRLVKAGFKVAICDQMEDPAEARKRGHKEVVRRAVTRILTPGTLTEDAHLEPQSHNYLAAYAEASGAGALAWIELSTGDFFLSALGESNTNTSELDSQIARILPRELLVDESLLQNQRFARIESHYAIRITARPKGQLSSQTGSRRLRDFYRLSDLTPLGELDRAELAAAGGLVDYLDLTLKGQLPELAWPKKIEESRFLQIDAATRKSLEITEARDGERQGSLLWAINRTKTAGGNRLLAEQLSHPSTELEEIEKRLEGVAFFLANHSELNELRQLFTECPDLERSLTRLMLDRGGPRDLAAVGRGLALSLRLAKFLADWAKSSPPPLVKSLLKNLGEHSALVEKLNEALKTELPHLARDGGFIQNGYSAELDQLRLLGEESRRHIANLQADYARKLRIASLKVKYNKVLGYFLEVSALHAEKVPQGADSPFKHRQSLVNARRFVTQELSELEGKILEAGERALALELELFQELRAAVLEKSGAIKQTAKALAQADVLQSQAFLAQEQSYIRPVLNGGTDLHIEGGRHPVVEQSGRLVTENTEARFIPNDCRLEQESNRLWLLTGPNMAGKSTYLRQNALIVVLAQAGGFVPAKAAQIGLVDKLFSRVGASDDLARGRSTFMVEMVETATILRQASPSSFVILDEIGRGTSTYDGLSLAWAILEFIYHQTRCRGLFATHFHELAQLAERLPALSCHMMRTREWQGELRFLHEVGEGRAERSFGIHVAKLAGLPRSVLARAEEILLALESQRHDTEGQSFASLPLFAQDLPLSDEEQFSEPPAPASGSLAVMNHLAALDLDALTPREALEQLYSLKELLD